MSSTILNLSTRSPIDGTESFVLATSGANWKAQMNSAGWDFGDMSAGVNHNNFLTLTGAATLNAPFLQPGGTDTNITLWLLDKGSGGIAMISNGNSVAQYQNSSASSVNGFLFGGNTTGNAPFIAVQGDTNIDIQIVPAGTGVVQFKGGSFSADGTVATVLGSLGPTGANTTVQEWLTVKNASGTVRYIPCF